MIQFSSEHFQSTHGHKPGQCAECRAPGTWAFTLGRHGSYTTVRFNAKYAEAKRAAISEARSLGCTSVTVEA